MPSHSTSSCLILCFVYVRTWPPRSLQALHKSKALLPMVLSSSVVRIKTKQQDNNGVYVKKAEHKCAAEQAFAKRQDSRVAPARCFCVVVCRCRRRRRRSIDYRTRCATSTRVLYATRQALQSLCARYPMHPALDSSPSFSTISLFLTVPFRRVLDCALEAHN